MAFIKGKSGNPAGKPTGCTDKRTALRSLLVPHAEKLIRKVVDLALSGDTTALRICIDRLVSPLRASDNAIRIDGFVGSPAAMAAQVLKNLADGTLTPDQATSVMQSLSAQVRILEVDDLARRVAALEQNKKEVEHV